MKISRHRLHEQIHLWLCLIIALSFPFFRLVPVFIAILVMNWIIEGCFTEKIFLLKRSPLTYLFIGFYLFHLLGMLWTENIISGWFDLQVKLSLFIFPIIFSTKPFNLKQLRFTFFGLTTGCVISSLILLIYSLQRFYLTGKGHFYYMDFSVLGHPSYLSMYLNILIIWLLRNLILENKNDIFLHPVFSAVLILFFSFIILLLSSKMGIITLLLIYVTAFLYFILVQKKYVKGFITLIVLISGMYFFLAHTSNLYKRIQFTIQALSSGKSYYQNSEGTQMRIAAWKAGLELIENNFLTGTGTGDVKDQLMEIYNKNGMVSVLEYRLNAHNQFLQTTIALGFAGGMFLLLCFLLPVWISIKRRKYQYIFFLLVIMLNFSVESMLETQAGTMFYAFFNSLFFSER